MAIELNPEQERVVGQAIQAGLIRAADEAVEMGVACIRQQLTTQSGIVGHPINDDWSRHFAAWVESHATTSPLLSEDAISRESIYGGRGL